MVDKTEKVRQNELLYKKVCRFCLSCEISDLTDIYSNKDVKKVNAPLPMQVMACASIEVYSKDGMPQFICNECRAYFEFCYSFKQMCKKADTCLRHYPITGQWTAPLVKPKLKIAPKNLNAAQNIIKKNAIKEIDEEEALNKNMKALLEDGGVETSKKEKPSTQIEIEIPELDMEYTEVPRAHKKPTSNKSFTTKKLLNKSAIRILNKEAHKNFEPVISKPVLTRDTDGKLTMVTQVLEQEETAPKLDPVKNAAVVATNVFPCPHCERSFPLRQLLDIHMVNHNRERSFNCEHCERKFFSKYDLQKHNLTHTGEKPFKCVVCDKGFTRSTLLHRHEKTHTDIPKYICVFCEKPFISQDEMEKHTERHRKKRPFTCKICDKSFAFKQGLERHEVVHCRVQPFQCQYCDQSFSTPSKLSRHLTAHAGSRPYPCKLCPKSYLLSHHLTRHMRSHKDGTGSYKCNICDKCFGSRDDLIYHSAVHATQTMMCPLCKDVFTDIESITDHVEQHAEGEAFACEFCDLIFMTSDRLAVHTEAEHVVELMAYNEDDEKFAAATAAAAAAAKNQTEEGKIDANDNSSKEIEGYIEEFLIDEIEEENSERKEKPSTTIIKEETDWSNRRSAEQTSYGASLENGSVDGESFEFSKIIDMNEIEDEPPQKIRKTNVVQVVKKTPPTPVSVQRKVPVKQPQPSTPVALKSSSPKENQKPPQKTPQSIKVEPAFVKVTPKTRQPTIQAALRAIPKSVSVKKVESPSAPTKPLNKSSPTENNVKKNSETKTSPNASTRMLRQRPETSPTKNIPQPKPSTSPQNSHEVKKASPPKVETVTTTTSPVKKIPAQVTTDKKIVEMMIGDKKVKVQKITMSKAEVAAMTADGRILMKEGTMILKKNRNVPTKEIKIEH